MSAYRKDFDKTKYMSFFDKNDEVLEKYNEIWEKVKNITKKEFDSGPVFNEKYLKAKTNNKIPQESSHFICLSVILFDSVYIAGKNYCPQVFRECKYVVKEKKIPKHIIDNLEISSDSDRENSDTKNSGEEKFDKKNSEEEN